MGCTLCEHCTALCCHYVALPIETPETARDFDDMRWYLMHEDMLIFVEEGDWYLQINRRCKHLLPDNRCGVYATRPAICREYKAEDCDYRGGDYDYDHLFKTPESIDAFGKAFLRKKTARRGKGKGRTTRNGTAGKKGRLRRAG